MNREQVLKLIDENNAEISKLQAQLKECLKKDKWLLSQLRPEPVKAYTGHAHFEQQWNRK